MKKNLSKETAILLFGAASIIGFITGTALGLYEVSGLETLGVFLQLLMPVVVVNTLIFSSIIYQRRK